MAAIIVVGALAPAITGLAWLVSRSTSSPLRTDAPASAVIVPVGTALRDRASPVKVTVVAAAPRELKAAGPGVITTVNVRAGQQITAGLPIIAVNDRSRVAFAAAAPLWRDITPGLRGDDVTRIQEFLAVLGHQPGSTKGLATPATVAAIRAFNQSLGYPVGDGTLHRESLVWIGPEPVAVVEVLVRPGDLVTDGTPLIRGPSEPAAIALTEPDIFTPSQTPYVLSVGEAQVPYVTGSLRVQAPEAVAAVVAALRGQTEGAGLIRLASPERVATLPVAAIITDGEGRLCVFDSVTGPPMAVEPLGGSLSTADVALTWAGRNVLVNPRDVRTDLACA